MDNLIPRKRYLDLLKGIGIFFVVYEHVVHVNIIREYILDFHMPLFFFISGFLFYPRKYNSISEFIKRKIKTLYFPYIFFFLITFCYWALIERNIRGNQYSIMHQFIGLFYGTSEGEHMHFNGALWFLPCLFITEILFYPISKFKNTISLITALIFIFIIGTILYRNNINNLPFGLHTAFFAIIFYGIGYLSKNSPSMICSSKNYALIILGCFIIQILCLGHYSSTIQESTFPYIFLALLGIFLYLSLSIWMNHNKILEFIGKNSIVIFALHQPIYRVIIFFTSKLCNQDIEYIRNNILYSLIITIITISTNVPFIILYNKYMKKIFNKIPI